MSSVLDVVHFAIVAESPAIRNLNVWFRKLIGQDKSR
jgi:hypothetical protein